MPKPAPMPEPAPLPEPALQQQQARPEPCVSYEHIEITDIRRLPLPNRHLCNNSFLVHGFFNYHYLVLKSVEDAGQTKRFLGVPGIYEQRERMMAMLYGFPEFEAAQPEDITGANGLFGYWMCPVAE
jgi:hypothetical protein